MKIKSFTVKHKMWFNFSLRIYKSGIGKFPYCVDIGIPFRHIFISFYKKGDL